MDTLHISVYTCVCNYMCMYAISSYEDIWMYGKTLTIVPCNVTHIPTAYYTIFTHIFKHILQNEGKPNNIYIQIVQNVIYR